MIDIGRIVMIVFFVFVCRTASAQTSEFQSGKDSYLDTHSMLTQVSQMTTTQDDNHQKVVTGEEILSYTKKGISFNYDSSMKVSSEDDPEGITIKIESELSPMVAIQEYRSAINPEDVVSTLIEGLKNALIEKKVVVSDMSVTDASMMILSENRSGKSVDFVIKGLRHKTSFFAVPASNRIIGLIFQYSTDDTELARKQFETIADSLAIQ